MNLFAVKFAPAAELRGLTEPRGSVVMVHDEQPAARSGCFMWMNKFISMLDLLLDSRVTNGPGASSLRGAKNPSSVIREPRSACVRRKGPTSDEIGSFFFTCASAHCKGSAAFRGNIRPRTKWYESFPGPKYQENNSQLVSCLNRYLDRVLLDLCLHIIIKKCPPVIND